MAEYHFDEGVIDLPSPWVDQTIQAITIPLDEGAKLGVTVSREDVSLSASLDALVDRAIADQQKKLAGFELVSRADSTAGGEPSVDLVVKWRHANAPIYQHQIFLKSFGKLLVFTGTTLWKHRGHCESVVHRIAESLRLRDAPEAT
jgi:hypothetical protein